MTLHIFAQCLDGFVIVSDRKETDEDNSENPVRKWLRSGNDDFFIALAGINLPKVLLDSLDSEAINSQNVEAEIKNIVRDYHSTEIRPNQMSKVGGFLVTKNENGFKLKIVEIIGMICTFSDNDASLLLIGATDAKQFANHFLRNRNFNEMTCEKASKYLIATMKELAKTVTAVGDETFGYDITRFSNSGVISNRKCFTGAGIANMAIDFIIDDSMNIFQDETASGDIHNE